MSHETSASLTSWGLMVALYIAPPPPGPTMVKSSAWVVRVKAQIASIRLAGIIIFVLIECFSILEDGIRAGYLAFTSSNVPNRSGV